MSRPRVIVRIACAVALLLCLAAWGRSIWRWDSLDWSNSYRFVSLHSSGGRLNLTITEWPNKTAWPSGWTTSSRPREKERPHWERNPDLHGRRRLLGFEWSESVWPMGESDIHLSFFIPTYHLVAVPYWALALLLALPLIQWAVARRRRRDRLRRQRCPDCGYDLRASPGRCPECGTAGEATGGAVAPAPRFPPSALLPGPGRE